jgi:hypothetical protein
MVCFRSYREKLSMWIVIVRGSQIFPKIFDQCAEIKSGGIGLGKRTDIKTCKGFLLLKLKLKPFEEQ